MDLFTEEQQGHARLAQALREMVPHVQDISLGELPGGIPARWPADNIREVLSRAADLIDTLTIRVRHK